jgi:hypothetical protein
MQMKEVIFNKEQLDCAEKVISDKQKLVYANRNQMLLHKDEFYCAERKELIFIKKI